MCEFDKLDKTFASDLYLIYKSSPSAGVCISDTDQLLMFYLSLRKLKQWISRLVFSPIHFWDFKKISCTNLKYDNLILDGKPFLLRQLKNVTVHLGKTAVFRCEITGSPSKIRWRKNDVIVPHTPRFRSRSYSWGGLLRIRNVRVTDYGLYSCKAKNALGQVTSNKARLHIKGL